MVASSQPSLHRLIPHISSSRIGAKIFAPILHHFDRVFLKLSGGRRTLTGALSGLPVVMLTTKGAKSGLNRTVPLLYIQNPDNPDEIALIASNWGQYAYPAWYFNLSANPQASTNINGQIKTYRAHEASGDEYERFWQLATKVYWGFPRYKERASHRRIPIMILTAQN